ncbi:hypothetical protein AB0C42_02260 [Micromonospora taraxaci]|uniref:hypothetical protein n=1 Tax=Micromonospora taraxaci TaxID=1316803 RepID=UPI0033EAAAC6
MALSSHRLHLLDYGVEPGERESDVLVGDQRNPDLKGLMTGSANWDGSKGWTFGDDVKHLPGR